MLSLHYFIELLFDLTLRLHQEKLTCKYGENPSCVNAFSLESKIQNSNILKKSLSRYTLHRVYVFSLS